MNSKQGLVCLNAPLILCCMEASRFTKANTEISFNSPGIHLASPTAVEAIFRRSFMGHLACSRFFISDNESQSHVLAYNNSLKFFCNAFVDKWCGPGVLC